MPYFSFSLKKNYDISSFKNLNLDISQFKPNTKYFSKNTKLWKLLSNEKNNYKFVNFINKEKRNRIKKIENSILFCLPPSIGLGDSVEYGLSIKSIIESKNFSIVGVAFVGKYKLVLEKYFNINNIYDEIIDENEISSYKTVFHFTLEIKELFFQKYKRQNIEKILNEYFNVPFYRRINMHNKRVTKISIFPISKSPIRTMTIDLLNYLIENLHDKYEIEVILDNNSKISNYLSSKFDFKKCNVLEPDNLSTFLKVIENIEYGVFMDSGPLHIAKILSKKGVLISSSVSSDVLLHKFSTINPIINNYKSEYCMSPCGLVNIFNYNQKIGCYDSIKINKNKIFKLKNLKSLQRGGLKENYINLISNPVNCLKNINKENVYNKIINDLNNIKSMK